MKPWISFVTLGVRDVEQARAFYCDGLGLVPHQVLPEVVFIDMGRTRLALWQIDEMARDLGVAATPPGFRGTALAHNVSSPADVDALLAQAAAGGGRIVKAGQPTFWGGYAGYFADPDGHLWEVAWNAQFLPEE